ncbi:flavoprotein [Nocardia sp. NPDC049149]|uniref:flavoprotein n=1 Tax=Nocardia sp. NPDC049149 TaxID=3364315 RepID=UPI0037160DA2
MRIILFSTGTLNSCFLPVWINWMKANRAADTVRVVLSRQATKFVSAHSIHALSGTPVAIDSWDDPVLCAESFAPHTWLADHDVLLVYPATLNTLSRIAAVDASTPMLSAVQSTAARIVLAPNLPPGADRNPAVLALLDTLRERPGTVVVDPVARPSASVAENAAVAPPIWDVFPIIDADPARRVA